MHGIIALALKDLRVLTREKAALFWVIGFPIIMAIGFGSFYSGLSSGSGSNKISIAVVDDDHTDGSKQFIDKLRASKSLEVTELDREAARNAVRTRKLTAYLALPKGFGDTSLFSGTTAEVELGIDPSRRAEEGFLQGILMETWFSSMRSMFTDKQGMLKEVDKAKAQIAKADGLNGAQRLLLVTFFNSLEKFFGSLDTLKGSAGAKPFEPVKIKKVSVTREKSVFQRLTSPFEISFPSAILWAFIGCVTGFAVSIVLERKTGTMLRLSVTPMSRAQILAGKGLSCFLAGTTVATALMVLGHFAFGVRFGNVFYLALAIVCTGFCFSGIMMFVSTLGRTEQAVAGASTATMLVLAMFGGGMIPLLFMPGWCRTISNFSPVKWGIYALEGAIWRDFSFAEMLTPLAILLAIGTAGFWGGVALMTRAEV